MAKIVVEEQKEFAVLPADSILHLKVDELKVKEVDGQNGKWEKLEFTFKILGIQAVGDGSPVEDYENLISTKIWGSVPFRLTDSPENRLRQWAEAILGIELGVGYELDTDHFERREVRGVTTTYNKRSVNPKTGQPFKAHQIDSLLPKAGGYAAAAPAPAAANPWETPVVAPVNDPWATPGVDPDEPPF